MRAADDAGSGTARKSVRAADDAGSGAARKRPDRLHDVLAGYCSGSGVHGIITKKRKGSKGIKAKEKDRRKAFSDRAAEEAAAPGKRKVPGGF